MFACAWWYYGPGVLLAFPPGLWLRADRAVRHRPRAPPPAERRSRCRASSSASCSACSPRRAGWRRSSASSSAAACCGAWPRRTTGSGTRTGSGMGDVKMLAMIGAFLGWKLTLVTLMMASLSGTVIGVASHRHQARRHEVRAAVRHVPRARSGGRRDGRAVAPRVVHRSMVMCRRCQR